jgi:trigger factor
MARYEESSEEPAAPDDMLKIDYRGMAGEQPVREIVGDSSQLGEGTDFWVILSEREFLPGFSKALQGLKAGDSKSVTVDFPVDYQVSELAGKQAVYEVTVKTVRKKRLPEIDEEFLKSMEAESEDDLRQKARDQLMAAKEDNERQRLKNEIADFLLEKTDLQVPDSQVEQEKNVIARNMVQRMAQQGLTRQQLEEQKDDLLKNAAESSVNRVKLMYILRSIADEENVEVGDEELETRVESMAAGYGMEKAQMKAELEKQNSLPRMRSEIRQDKTLDYLLEQAKVKK